MADVSWTPYVQVEYGEVKQLGTTYYYLTDHSDYEVYDHADSEWMTDTLNGRVYTYDDSKDESVITDLSLLDRFYDDYALAEAQNRINYFTNNIESMQSQKSYPTISGEMYISNANGNPVDEFALTDKYAICWPNLKIRAAKVDKAYVAKYVQRINGKDNELDILRSAKAVGAHPRYTAKRPALANYDFVGWTLDPQYSIVNQNQVDSLLANHTILQQADIEAMEFDTNNDIYIFYTVFTITQFAANFRNPNGDILYTTNVNYGSYLTAPPILPSTDESQLELEERYKFIGWLLEPENPSVDCFPKTAALATGLVNVSKIKSQTMDKNFYACYVKEDVHANATDVAYFAVTRISVSDYNAEGWDIKPATGMQLSGKITIPASITSNGQTFPVVSMSGFSSQTNLTHIFFEDGSLMNRVAANTFESSNLQYFEVPLGLKYLGENAFYKARSLQYFNVPEGILYIGNTAFNQAFTLLELGDTPIFIPGSIQYLGARAYSFCWTKTHAIQFGSAENPLNSFDYESLRANYTSDPSNWIFGFNGYTITNMSIYSPSALSSDQEQLFQMMTRETVTITVVPV